MWVCWVVKRFLLMCGVIEFGLEHTSQCWSSIPKPSHNFGHSGTVPLGDFYIFCLQQAPLPPPPWEWRRAYLWGSKSHGRVGCNRGESVLLTRIYYLITSAFLKFYAALHEWSTGERKHIDFTANMYLDVYNCHINALEKIERNCQKPFQNMMADIFRLAVWVSRFYLIILLTFPKQWQFKGRCAFTPGCNARS